MPGTTATEEELLGIGRAMGRVGHGVFEMASDLKREWNEFDWMGELSRETGMPVTFAALQSLNHETSLDEQISSMRAENARGANIVAQIALRGNGIVMAWQGTVHPFLFKAAWWEIMELPWDQQLAHLRDPVFRQRMIEEQSLFPEDPDVLALYQTVAGGWHRQYEMGSDFNYEQGVGSVGFGTYIAPKIYASYGIGLFENENVIRLRYELKRGFGITGTSGQRDSGFDLSYRFEN